MYSQLKELAEEYVTQPNRSTRMPYLFQIQTTEEIPALEGNGEAIWVNRDGDTLRTDEEIKDKVIEYLCEKEYEKPENNDNTDDDILVDVKERVKYDMDEHDIEVCLTDDVDEGWHKIYVDTQKVYSNAFFTAKACKEHIEANHYHYNEPRDYLKHAWRNPEMELISNFLELIAKK